MNAIFLGPPGAGKGTQAVGQARRLALLYLATGDQLRAAVKAGTPLGLQAKTFMDAGELVPDDVIIGLVRDVLARHPDARGVLFDGFPRTVGQAEALDALFARRNEAIDTVVYIDVPADAVVARRGGRRVCRACGATNHGDHKPPKVPGRCDACPDGGDLYQRDDDQEQTVRERLRVYGEQTAPLLDYYRAKNLLVPIDGAQTIAQVRQAVTGVLDTHVA